jgi:hypothetical protein
MAEAESNDIVPLDLLPAGRLFLMIHDIHHEILPAPRSGREPDGARRPAVRGRCRRYTPENDISEEPRFLPME